MHVHPFWLLKVSSFALLQHNFEPQWLSLTFAKAIFLGNGLVAIVAGLIANFLVVDLDFGPVAPFDTASIFLAIGCAIIVRTWSENYGDTNEDKTLQQQFKQAWDSIVAGKPCAFLRSCGIKV